MASSRSPNGITSEKVDSANSIDQSGCEKNKVILFLFCVSLHLVNYCDLLLRILYLLQVTSIPNGTVVGNLLANKADACSKISIHDKSAKLTGSSIVKNGSIHVEDFECKSPKNLKKKILKSRIASMHFHSSILFRASLGLRKKKKHKRCKHRNLDAKNLRKELLKDTYCFPSDLGPSTSENTHTKCLVSKRSRTKEAKSGTKKEANGAALKDEINSHGGSLINVVDGEFRERIDRNNTVLASDKQLKNSSCSLAANASNVMETGSSQDCKRDKMQNGWMGVLTRGMEETVGE